MMERVVFADSWQEFFAEFGLRLFDDFFCYAYGEKVEENRRRNVVRLAFGNEADRKVFFLKRFHHPHFKNMFFTFRNFGHFCSQAACEWHNAKFLLDNGIKTYRPVCYGEQMKCGVERKSFLITEKLQSQCFTDFAARNWSRLARSQKGKILLSLAKLIRRVHDLNIGMPDLFLWHIFIREDFSSEDYQLSIIDLDRMSRNVKNRNKKVKDLGKLLWSMSPKYFDNELKDLFVCAYMGDDWMGSKAALAGRIQKRVNVISRRRKLRYY